MHSYYLKYIIESGLNVLILVVMEDALVRMLLEAHVNVRES